MTIQFTEAEYKDRRTKVAESLQRDGLDGVLIFRQESMYYLTGYDTFGYCFFQCLYLDANGEYALLTRAPDRLQAELSLNDQGHSNLGRPFRLQSCR